MLVICVLSIYYAQKPHIFIKKSGYRAWLLQKKFFTTTLYVVADFYNPFLGRAEMPGVYLSADSRKKRGKNTFKLFGNSFFV